MAFDILIQRRLEEIEEELLKYDDPIERMFIWFNFIKDFTQEAHFLFDKQYEEFVRLCTTYADTPDPTARKELRKQVRSCVKEINRFNQALKKIPKLQSQLEKEIIK